MTIVWTIAGIVVLYGCIKILYAQSYNLVFILAKRPVVWLAIVFGIALSVWFISSMLEWSVSTPIWASTLFVFSHFVSQHDAKTILRKEGEAAVDEIFADIGIRHGTRFSRAGPVVFAVASVLSWIAFYGQVCSAQGRCQSLLGALL